MVAGQHLSSRQFEALIKVRRWVDEHPRDDGEPPEFEWHDVGVLAVHLNTLLTAGYLDRSEWWSNKHKRYRLAADAPPLPEWYVHDPALDGADEQDDVPPELFRDIVGYEDVKWAIDTTLRERRRVHHLLEGPPGTAKTMFLEEIERLPNTEWMQGAATTGPGLRQLIIQQQPDFIILDEIDHLNLDAQHALHDIMEAGMVRETMFGKRIVRRTDCVLFASANETKGLSSAVLSRFERWTFEPYKEAEYVQVVTAMLSSQFEMPEEFASYIARRTWASGSRDVRGPRRIASLCTSKSEVERYLQSPHRKP